MDKKDDYLGEAILEARYAYEKGEVPVGAVIVFEGTIVARAHNLKETTKDCTAHAELLAIKQAQVHLGDWRLNHCVLYSTLEPCPMCMGAILHARIETVIYGAYDLKWGACVTKVTLSEKNRFNHYTKSDYVNRPECAQLLTDFFKEKRR